MSADQNNQDAGKHRSHFAAAAAGVGITAALALGALLNAPAHVPSAEKNKEQHDLLAPYAGVVMYMERKDGGHCCGMQDGVGKVPEKHTDYPAVTDAQGHLQPDPSGTHYHVHLTKDQYGHDLVKDVWLDIPDNLILDLPQLEAVKAKHADDPTFKTPPFNILWTNNSYPTEQSPSNKPNVYCFWPTPRIQ